MVGVNISVGDAVDSSEVGAFDRAWLGFPEISKVIGTMVGSGETRPVSVKDSGLGDFDGAWLEVLDCPAVVGTVAGF